MESLGYVLLYFLKGSLSWQNVNAATKRKKYEKVCEMKQSTPVEMLCESLPAEFVSYMLHCHSLRFDERPDYKLLRRLFQELLDREGYSLDYMFDWTIKKDQQEQESKKTVSSPAVGGNSGRALPMDVDKNNGGVTEHGRAGNDDVSDAQINSNLAAERIVILKALLAENLSLTSCTSHEVLTKDGTEPVIPTETPNSNHGHGTTPLHQADEFSQMRISSTE
ncbi:hypothetical protein RND81_08G050500 [Saponaria officinalis]|uniref:Non-specific serine/threonine protein kinase n=1 Tax=Saponaria officinalis TaxID=3572 RepID=A0AAW1J3N4_SAPOF